MVIGGCLKVGKTIIDMAPQVFIVSAQCGIEVLPKDGAKPVNENPTILVSFPIVPPTKCNFGDMQACKVHMEHIRCSMGTYREVMFI